MFTITLVQEVTLGDLVTAVGFGLTLFSLYLARKALELNTRAESARFLLDVVDQHFEDEAMVDFFYKLDYPQYSFDRTKDIGSKTEIVLDRILYTCDIVGRMHRLGVVTTEEVNVLAFRLYRILSNPEIQKYLHWLDEEYREFGPSSLKGIAHADARYLLKVIHSDSEHRGGVHD